jgi:hypothetical protein
MLAAGRNKGDPETLGLPQLRLDCSQTHPRSFRGAERRGIWVFAGHLKNPDPSLCPGGHNWEFIINLCRLCSAGQPGGGGLYVILGLPFSAAHLQIGADERLQVAVDHAIHVADFHLGAMIFDKAVGLQGVRTYLRAEADV